MTKAGFDQIKKKYDHLVKNKRPAVLNRLAEARSAGDLSENTEYSSAKDELAFIDARLEELGKILARARLVEKKDGGWEQAGLGCQVTVRTNKGQLLLFRIVGEWEADPIAKKISYQSPLGRSLLGKKAGDQVEVEAPAGKIIYTIAQIR
jgi:transcription elongation factor GreA